MTYSLLSIFTASMDSLSGTLLCFGLPNSRRVPYCTPKICSQVALLMEFKLSIRLSEPAQGLLPRTDSDFRGAPRRILRNEIGIVYKGLQLAFGSNLPKVRARLVVDRWLKLNRAESKPH